MINGIININKSDALTSFKVVSLVKKKLGIKKVGHLGTLDPAGCGVLPIAVNKATKLFDYYLNKRKVYRACFYFGKETDTLDSEGKLICLKEKIVTSDDINAVLSKLIGVLEQMPPKYSAKSINGVRAYDLARSGVEFELKPKTIEVFRFELVKQLKQNLFLFEIECSAGCYIRSLCRDLAYLLDTVAYMPLIIRTKAGEFTIENSVPFETLEASDNITQFITPIEDCLHYDKIVLNESDAKKVENGLSIKYNLPNNFYLLYDNSENFFALGKAENEILKMEVYFGD